MLTGTNHEMLHAVGWLDLRKGPQVLHVPDMADHHYNIELVDPWDGSVSAYIDQRTTDTQAGDYLISDRAGRERYPRG